MTTELSSSGARKAFARQSLPGQRGQLDHRFRSPAVGPTPSADPSQWPDVERDVEAERHFAPDVARFRAGVRKLITEPLDPDSETALVSFAYNLGLGALQGSKLRKLINFDTADSHARWTARVILEWVDWSNITIGGRKQASAGLVDRRRREAALFFGVSLG